MKINYKDFVYTYPPRYRSALFYPLFLKLKKKGLSFNHIKMRLSDKVPKQTIYSWFYGRVPLPFKEFQNIKNKFNKKDLERLATIVGHTLGDGGITKQMFLRYCNKEEFLIKEFKGAVRSVFHIKPVEHKEKSGIIRITYPRLISRVLICLFGKFSRGVEGKKITPQIDRMPLWWKIKVLQALYNDDGSVPEWKYYRCVALKQKEESIILWVQKVLKQLKISARLTKDRNTWQLRITSYSDIKKFRDKVNFSKGYRKQLHLDDIIEKIKYPHWKTKEKIVKLLKRKPRTRKELANLLSIDQGTVYGHLHGWKRIKRKSTLGLVDLGLVKIKKVGRINLYYV